MATLYGQKINQWNDENVMVMTDQNGAVYHMVPADAANAMADRMRVATLNENGLMPQGFADYYYGPSPSIAKVGQQIFKTNINSLREYCTIEVDIEGPYGHNTRSLDSIHISFRRANHIFSGSYYRLVRGNAYQVVKSAIIYKGSNGFYYLVLNTNLNYNCSLGFFVLSVRRNFLMSVNCMESFVTHESTNYVKGTNQDEIECVIT